MPGICARCEKTVYFNEEKLAIGKSFHVRCFICANTQCNRRLDSNNLTEHNGDIFCRACYGKLFGPKGYGYGAGSGILSTETNDTDFIAKSNGNSNETSSETASVKVSNLIAAAATNNGNNAQTTNGQKYGTTDKCPRCGKVVYMAEKMMGGGSAWHKLTCFSCKECNKKLESTTLCEREGEIYCKTCYGRKWGPKGYGFGGGGGQVLQTS